MAASQPAYFNVQEFADAGLLLFAGRLYTYVQGTTTHQTAYTDPAGLVPQTYTSDGLGGLYIALNARGELPTPLYLGSNSYDLCLKRSDGSTVWTRRADGVDNAAINGLADLTADLAAGSVPIGYVDGSLGSVLRTNKLADSRSVFDFMTELEIADVKSGAASVDVTVAVKAALASGPVRMEPGTYSMTDGITITSSVYFIGRPTFKFALGTAEPTPIIPALIYVTAPTDMSGVVVDGTTSAKVTAGVFVDASSFPVWPATPSLNYDVEVKNIANSDNTKSCQGFTLYVSSGATNTSLKATIRGQVNSVVATANGIIGDTQGNGTGILVSINKAGTDNNIEILESGAYGVRPAEDGDGIHIFVVDHTSDTAKGSYRITRCKAGDNAKRGIKSQAQNCTITDPYIDCDLSDGLTSSSIGIDCYGQNTVVINPVIKSSFAGDGVALRGDRSSLFNPIMRMLQPTVPIRIDSSIDFEVNGGSVYTEKNFTNNNSPIISVNTGCSGYIRAPLCINSLSKGSIVQCQSLAAADTVVIDILVPGTAESLVAARFCAGTVIVNDVRGTCSGTIVDLSDCSEVRINHVTASTTAAVGVFAVRGTTKMNGSGRISGFTTVGVSFNGVALGTGKQSITGDWQLIGNSAPTAVVLSNSADSECEGIYTEGITTNHINISSSTKCFVGNCRARGAGTHVLATSATGQVTYNNNIIV